MAFLWIAAIALQGEMVMEMLQTHKEKKGKWKILEQNPYVLKLMLDIANL